VAVTYYHRHVGKHTLPVVFEVGTGKQVALTLIGRTVAVMPAALTLTPRARVHRLAPVALGCGERSSTIDSDGGVTVPLQSYALVNQTDWPLHYELDLTAVDTLTDDNFGVAVFHFLK
jgi:hypothetical protein